MSTVTGRVVRVIRHGHTANGNPTMSIVIDASAEPGAYGIEAVPGRTNGSMRCYDCGRSWSKDITPAGRCPWESTHGEAVTYRISNDAGMVYEIENANYRDEPHTFVLTPAGRVSHVQHVRASA